VPIIASDIEFRYSGGAANTDPNACLGGAISTAGAGVVDTGVKNDLFDDVSSAEAAAGDIEYRGIYVKNNHGSITYEDCRVYISTDSANASDVIDIALADEAVTTTIETIANEGTAPVGPTFTHPTTYAGGLALNSTTGLAAAGYKGVWVRRTITAGAASGSITDNTLKVEGNTA
jgi:hypothetical protein